MRYKIKKANIESVSKPRMIIFMFAAFIITLSIVHFLGAYQYRTTGTYITENEETIVVSTDGVTIEGIEASYETGSGEPDLMMTNSLYGFLIGTCCLMMVLTFIRIERGPLNENIDSP